MNIQRSSLVVIAVNPKRQANSSPESRYTLLNIQTIIFIIFISQ